MSIKSNTTILLLIITNILSAGDYKLHSFRKVQLNEAFTCEGAHYGDFNNDGKADIAAGCYWYEGPDFKKKHAYVAPPEEPYTPLKYSHYFLTYIHDFNTDGWDDILVFGFPGDPVIWYENPQNKDGYWDKYVIWDVADGESPDLVDIDGDGNPEIFCHSSRPNPEKPKKRFGTLGFVKFNWGKPTEKGEYYAISPESKEPRKYFKYTHGYGAGDVNGDGRVDILERDGWWEQPERIEKGKTWKHHAYPFAPEGVRGGAHMYVYDVDADGLNDVISAWDAHGYGLSWYKQKKGKNGEITFEDNVIMNYEPEHNRYGVKFSQPHSQVLVDMNGDGLLDIVTGKRHWAHGPKKDPEPNAPAVLYWFELVRGADGVDWVPHLVDDDSGVGTQITAGDINGDGYPDIISGNKKGLHVFFHEAKKVSEKEYLAARPKPYVKK